MQQADKGIFSSLGQKYKDFMSFNGCYAGKPDYSINITDNLGKYTSISFSNCRNDPGPPTNLFFTFPHHQSFDQCSELGSRHAGCEVSVRAHGVVLPGVIPVCNDDFPTF